MSKLVVEGGDVGGSEFQRYVEARRREPLRGLLPFGLRVLWSLRVASVQQVALVDPEEGGFASYPPAVGQASRAGDRSRVAGSKVRTEGLALGVSGLGREEVLCGSGARVGVGLLY